MIQKIISTALAFLFIITVNAQEITDKALKPYDFKHAVGTNLGATTGVGLAYRFSHEKFSAQLAFWPRVEDFETNANLQTSLSFYYRLREYEHFILLLYQGNEYQYKKQSWYYCPPGYNCTAIYPQLIEQNIFSTSLGFGFELLIGRHVSVNIMLGYAAMDNFTIFKLKGESGLFFHF